MLLLLKFTSLSIQVMSRAQTALSAFGCTNSSPHLPTDATAEGKHKQRTIINKTFNLAHLIPCAQFHHLVYRVGFWRSAPVLAAIAAFTAPLPPRCVSPPESQATGHFSQVSLHKTSLRLTAIATDTHRTYIFSWRRERGGGENSRYR